MAMKGKMKSESGGRRRIRSKYEESDASDDDYKIEDDEDSDEYCSSLAGEESEDDLAEDKKVRKTRRLKRRNVSPSKSKAHVRKASKQRKISYKEDSDDDYIEDDDNLEKEEDCKDWRTGFPRRKRNGVKKVVQKKKVSYTEENEDEEAELKEDNDGAEDNNEFEDSDELEDDLAEDEKEEKLRTTARLKRRKASPSKGRGRVRKASKERKVSYKEDSDDDYVDGDDDLQEVDCKDWLTGFPKRKRNVLPRVLKKKASSTEENDDDEAELNDDSDEDEYSNNNDDDDDNENKEEKYLLISSPSRKRNGAQKAVGNKRTAYTEENDDDYESENYASDDDEDYNDDEEEDLEKGCPNRKRNGLGISLNEKKAPYTEEDDDDYEAEDDDEDYVVNEDEEDLPSGCLRKQNGVQKALKEKNDSHSEYNDGDYEAGDNECDDDEDYIDNEDREDLPNGCLRKQNEVLKNLKEKSDSPMEEEDDDYEDEDDEFDDNDNDNDNEKDLENGCSSRKQNGVLRAHKKKKASCMEENDDDYQAEDDDCNNDDDDDENDEEVELDEEEEDDEEFTPNEIDFDDEDEFLVVRKAKEVRQTSFSRGRKRKRNSRVISKSKKKKPARRRRLASKSSSVKGKSKMKETKERSSGSKRRLVVDSDSDFADSEQLLLGQDYTISEEEREQVREASKFCGRLDVTLSQEDENLHQERKNKVRKGKDKVEDSKNAAVAAKQVCGICFSEEGKRTVRGTLDCCSHYFCFNCIMEWSKVESRCPLCKQRFATITKPACDSRTTVIPVPERDQVYQPSEEEIRSYIDPYENVICTECHHGGDDANMLLCDLCDSPAHTYCVGLSEVPEGNWYCEGCRPTVLTPSNPQAPYFSRDRRTINDLSARSSPSENVREAIDLNRVYEPETPVAEGTGISISPRPVDGVGVQTVSERRRRHQQIAQFAGRTGVRLGPEVEWARTGRLVSQNTFQNSVNRPDTSSFQSTFSRGLLPDNFASSFQNTYQNSAIRLVPTMGPLSATPSHSRGPRVWGQTLTDVNNGSADASGSPQAGFAWPFHGHSPMQ